MSHSYAQAVQITCSNCGDAFSADVWLIIDAEERPDLMAQVSSDTLNIVTCPHCGYEGQVDTPLLIYQPHAEPHLIFYPAEETSEEEDVEQSEDLLARLAESLGNAWREEWVDEMEVMPDPLLSQILGDDIEAALPQLAALSAFQNEAELSAHLERLIQFVDADTWAESQTILEANPDLLDEKSDVLFDVLKRTAMVLEDEPVLEAFDEHQHLLRRCREVGIKQAFDEKMFEDEFLERAEEMGLTLEEFMIMKEAAGQLAPSIEDAIELLAAEGVEIESPSDLDRALDERPDLQLKLDAVAMDALIRLEEENPEVFETVVQLMQELGPLLDIEDDETAEE